MKFLIKEDCKYAFDHINATDFKAGQVVDVTDSGFASWLEETGFGAEIVKVQKIEPKKKATPKANKKAKGPDENK